MDWLTGTRFAHRGLHDLSKGIPENSCAAFAAAADAGYGIELDVRPSADHQPVVFHDPALDAVTDLSGPVAGKTVDELTRARLRGTGETIPTFERVLNLIGGRVPVLVEIKNPGRAVGALESAVLNVVRGYTGRLGVISFNARSLRWFLENAADVPRGRSTIGLWSTSGSVPLWRRMLIRAGNALVPSDPDFLTVDLPALVPGTRPLPVIAWTVRNARDRERAEKMADSYMFEGTKV
jgi:glycerophosphoryl diester phosphodiesterase